MSDPKMVKVDGRDVKVTTKPSSFTKKVSYEGETTDGSKGKTESYQGPSEDKMKEAAFKAVKQSRGHNR